MKLTCILMPLLLAAVLPLHAQGNTAITSGSVGKCAVWNYPATLYNTVAATQTVNSGVNVTVDQNRNFGAVNFSGNGGMDMSGANGITMSGSGSEINCRWDIPRSESHTIVNNNGVFSNNSRGQASISFATAAVFTAPYAGVYSWYQGSGWAASLSGAYLNGGVGVQKQGNDHYGNAFYQNQNGSCATSGAVAGPTWTNPLTPINLNAGQTLNYAASTAYASSGACTNTTFNFTIGNATIVFEN